MADRQTIQWPKERKNKRRNNDTKHYT